MMGVSIDLRINPKGISAQQWEAVYQESLSLLRGFPIPLRRVGSQQIASTERYLYSRELVNNEGTVDEHWSVSGDLLSEQGGEDFRLYRRPEHYSRYFFEEDWLRGKDHSVLWEDGEYLDEMTGNGFNLFGGKTQGAPFHLAIVAMGILFENRFPDQCFLTGNIDRSECEHMSRWPEHVKIVVA
jgi:hypothetical protein